MLYTYEYEYGYEYMDKKVYNYSIRSVVASFFINFFTFEEGKWY